MEEYYECRSYSFDKNSTPKNYLIYRPFWGKDQEIPLILVNDGGNIFEFFTKTRFVSKKKGYYSGFELPDSTLFYSSDSSSTYHYSKIFPADALKKLQPFMKKPSKYAVQINQYFAWFRSDFVRKQQEAERTNKANSDAQSVLSKFWKNH